MYSAKENEDDDDEDDEDDDDDEDEEKTYNSHTYTYFVCADLFRSLFKAFIIRVLESWCMQFCKGSWSNFKSSFHSFERTMKN